MSRTMVRLAAYARGPVSRCLMALLSVAAVSASGGALPVAAAGCQPGPATQLTASVDQSNAIVLNWTPPLSAPDGYNVFRGTAAGAEGTSPINSSLIAGSATSYTDAGLSNDETPYYYTVTAVCGGSSLKSTNEASGAADGTPPVPAGAAVAAADSQCSLTWSPVYANTANVGVTYTVYRGATASDASNDNFDTIFPAQATTSLTDTSVSNGAGPYVYQVKATAQDSDESTPDGTSAYSAAVSCNPAPQLPAAPTGLALTTASLPSGSSVSLTWTAPAVDANHGAATSYNVLRGSSATTLATIQTAVASASYTDSTVAPGGSYTYAVQAVNGVGSSGNSATQAITVAPAPPASFSATSACAAVDLAWTAPLSGSPTGYTIGRSATASGTYTAIKTAGASDTGYVDADSALTDGTTYFYEITATYAGGNAPVEGPVSAAPQACVPNAPSVTLSAGDGAVTLTITPDTHAGRVANYTVAYGTRSGNYTVTDSGITATTGNTTFTVSGLTDGTTYYLAVYANGDGGTSPASAEVSGTPLDASAAPAGLGVTLTAGATTAGASVAWTNVTGTTGTGSTFTYNLTRTGSDSSSKNYTGVVSPFTDTNTLANGVTYTYSVTAVNAHGLSSAASSTTTTPLSAPTGLTGSAPTGTKVNLAWTAVTGATSYSVTRGTGTPVTVTSPSYSDTTVANGSSYTYSVVAVNAGAQSLAATVNVSTPSPVGAPTSVTATIGNGTVTLTWGAVTNATGYEVDYGTTTLVKDSNYNGTATTDTISGLTNGATYTFNVYTLSAGGRSGTPASTTATPVSAPTVPGVPVVTVTAGSTTGTAALTWTAPTCTTCGTTFTYNVVRTATGQATKNYRGLTSASLNDTNALRNGVTYTYSVTALNAGGTSPAAAIAVTPLSAPSGVSAQPTSGSSVTVSWSAVTGATSYSVTSAQATGSPFSTATNSALITNLVAGHSYTFNVQAIDATATSLLSQAASATPPTAPGSTVVTATAGDGTASISWTAVSGASSYTVKFGPSNGLLAPDANYHGGTTDTFSGLTDGYQYAFTVTPNGIGGSGSTATATATPIQAPQGLLASVSGGNISLNWQAPVTANAYNVFRTGGSFTQRTQIGNVTSYTDSVVNPATKYTYVVTVSNTDHGSALSAARSATVGGTAPAAPGHLVAAPNPANRIEIDLAFDAVSDATGYVLERSTTSAGESSGTRTDVMVPNPVGGQAPAPVVTVADTSAAPGITYYYQVIAYSDAGAGSPSAEASATQPPASNCVPSDTAPNACVTNYPSPVVCVSSGTGPATCESIPPQQLSCVIPVTGVPDLGATAGCAGAPSPVPGTLSFLQTALNCAVAAAQNSGDVPGCAGIPTGLQCEILPGGAAQVCVERAPQPQVCVSVGVAPQFCQPIPPSQANCVPTPPDPNNPPNLGAVATCVGAPSKVASIIACAQNQVFQAGGPDPISFANCAFGPGICLGAAGAATVCDTGIPPTKVCVSVGSGLVSRCENVPPTEIGCLNTPPAGVSDVYTLFDCVSGTPVPAPLQSAVTCVTGAPGNPTGAPTCLGAPAPPSPCASGYPPPTDGTCIPNPGNTPPNCTGYVPTVTLPCVPGPSNVPQCIPAPYPNVCVTPSPTEVCIHGGVVPVTQCESVPPQQIACLTAADGDPGAIIACTGETPPSPPALVTCLQAAGANPSAVLACANVTPPPPPSPPAQVQCLQAAGTDPNALLACANVTQPTPPTLVTCLQTAGGNPSEVLACANVTPPPPPSPPAQVQCLQAAGTDPTAVLACANVTQPTPPPVVSCLQAAGANPSAVLACANVTQPTPPPVVSCLQAAGANPSAVLACANVTQPTPPPPPTPPSQVQCLQAAGSDPNAVLACADVTPPPSPTPPAPVPCVVGAGPNPTAIAGCAGLTTPPSPTPPAPVPCVVSAVPSPSAIAGCAGVTPPPPPGGGCVPAAAAPNICVVTSPNPAVCVDGGNGPQCTPGVPGLTGLVSCEASSGGVPDAMAQCVDSVPGQCYSDPTTTIQVCLNGNALGLCAYAGGGGPVACIDPVMVVQQIEGTVGVAGSRPVPVPSVQVAPGVRINT
ncbi:MAG: fibronectin type III domain-containing protein [Candidatus Dormibacteria bacterium]